SWKATSNALRKVASRQRMRIASSVSNRLPARRPSFCKKSMWERPQCRDVGTLRSLPHSLTAPHAQKRIGIQQKFEISFYFRKVKVLESRVPSQQREIFAGLCFESHGRIDAGFTPRDPHDFKDRSVMEFVA